MTGTNWQYKPWTLLQENRIDGECMYIASSTWWKIIQMLIMSSSRDIARSCERGPKIDSENGPDGHKWKLANDPTAEKNSNSCYFWDSSIILESVFFALFKSSIAFLFFFPSFLSLSPFNAFKMMQRSIATQLAAIISSSVIYNIWIADPVNAQDYGKISRRNRATVKRAALGIVSTLWQLFKIS